MMTAVFFTALALRSLEFDRFEANLKRLAKVVEKDKKNLAFEEEAFKHEQNHFPQNVWAIGGIHFGGITLPTGL